MATFVNEFRITGFRGLQNAELTNLNDVNLVVGDNNCGKTSVLEALLLLRNPQDFANLLRIARMREPVTFFGRTSLYENFHTLFAQDGEKGIASMEMDALVNSQNVKIIIDGEERLRLLDDMEVYSVADSSSLPMEANGFIGEMKSSVDGKEKLIPIGIHEYSTAAGVGVKRNNFIKMKYLSPMDHMRGNIINAIVRNENYKKICIKIIQIFDENIEDLLILKNEVTNKPVEYIRHRTLGMMPIGSYGDGIKKVLLLANAIAQATGGVLLVDEVETAIHAQYYDDVFRFMVKACKQYEVQLFITTHNLEAVDAILATQDYETQNTADGITVITLKKSIDKTYSRILSGRRVHENREAFGFEVRL